MSKPDSSIVRLFARSPKLPLAIYCGLFTCCLAITSFSVVHSFERYETYRDSLSRLVRLQQHPVGQAPDSRLAAGGSLVLEGSTATIASAALLQRVNGAVTGAGGTIASSEVEQGGVPSKDGYLKVITNFEMSQDGLQRVLHDLESGMPFLFIEQLLVQNIDNDADAARLRVPLAVSGLWIGGR
jgi:general secretion pathway protein M